MKKIWLIALTCLLMLALVACGGNQNESMPDTHQASQELTNTAISENDLEPQTNADTALPDTAADGVGSNSLVVYFSHTGTTEEAAKEIQTQTGADLFEIIPEIPYADDYNTLLDIARTEQTNNERPAFTGGVEGFEEYDTIFLGYPIWHGTCPMIMVAFLETYDFSGKTIIPFCTSGSTDITRSISEIQQLCGDSVVLDGLGLSGSAASTPQSAVETWLDGMDVSNLTRESSESSALVERGNTIHLTIGEKNFTATLADNASAEALKELLADGPITMDMRDYGNIEKVGELGASLPTDDQQITTEPGDLMLHQGNSLVIYYVSNTWNLTRLGKINDVSEDGLKEVFGSGNVTVTLSLGQDPAEGVA